MSWDAKLTFSDMLARTHLGRRYVWYWVGGHRCSLLDAKIRQRKMLSRRITTCRRQRLDDLRNKAGHRQKLKYV